MALPARQHRVIAVALLTICILIIATGTADVAYPDFTENDMASMRAEIKGMFYHAYGNYMDRAFPADELKPISCKPRERGENRGSLDDVLGDYSLTLVDSLDTLLILGDIDEFNKAVHAVISTVRFDRDVNVSVFEATIRVIGGLLSAHLQALEKTPDYKGQLLSMSVDLADRLLPAFNTKTGIPYSRVNLQYGIIPKEKPESCTACAGTLIMEFGLLSKLTKNPVYERVAKDALKALYNRRSAIGLVATTINVNSGQWTSRDSGIGAGIDSYYEYMLKAYLLFGDEEFYHMFNVSYAAVMKHIKKDNFYTNVDLITGQLKYNWIDSLSAFWPGLQVLAGDVQHAEKAWSKFYYAWRKYQVGLPERYDFLHFGATLKFYPLRPEFIESTYFLYQATKNPFYLHIGREIFNGLQAHTKTECGYATVTDVESKKLEDRMDSFFLSEVCKYLYLLFDPDNFVTKENFIFTTEGHFFPMNYEDSNVSRQSSVTERCKLARKGVETIEDLIEPLAASARNTTQHGQCDIKEAKHARELNATALNTPKYVITGLDPSLIGGIFVNLVPKSREAQLVFNIGGQTLKIYAGQAAFGPGVPPEGLQAHEVIRVTPADACSQLSTPQHWTRGRVAVIERGHCPFVQKVFYAQRAGASAAVVIDNVPRNGIFMMVNNGQDEDEPEIDIPSVLISKEDGEILKKYLIDPAELNEVPDSDDECIDSSSYAQKSTANLIPLRVDVVPLGTREDDQRLEFVVETKQKVNQGLFARAGIRVENNMLVFHTNENFKFDDPRLGGGSKEENGLPAGFSMNVMLDPRKTHIDLVHIDQYNKPQPNNQNSIEGTNEIQDAQKSRDNNSETTADKASANEGLKDEP